MVRRIIITDGGLLQLVPDPSEAGFVLGDDNPEAFEVFPLQVYLLLNPPSRGFDRFPFVSLSEVVQLSPELSTAPLEIIQRKLHPVLVFGQDTLNNLCEREVAHHRSQEQLQKRPPAMLGDLQRLRGCLIPLCHHI